MRFSQVGKATIKNGYFLHQVGPIIRFSQILLPIIRYSSVNPGSKPAHTEEINAISAVAIRSPGGFAFLLRE